MVLGFKVGPPGGNGLIAKVVMTEAEAIVMTNNSAKAIAAFFPLCIVHLSPFCSIFRSHILERYNTVI